MTFFYLFQILNILYLSHGTSLDIISKFFMLGKGVWSSGMAKVAKVLSDGKIKSIVKLPGFIRWAASRCWAFKIGIGDSSAPGYCARPQAKTCAHAANETPIARSQRLRVSVDFPCGLARGRE